MNINFSNISLFVRNISVSLASKGEKNAQSNEMPQISSSVNQAEKFTNQVLKFNSMTGAQQAALLRSILELPKDIKDFFISMITENNQQANLEILLSSNINIADVQEVLNANSKNAINNLLKIIQQSGNNIHNSELIKETSALLTSLLSDKNPTSAQTVKDIILLYLPYLPLMQKQDLEVALEKKNSEEEESENLSLIIYITTINLGKFKVAIYSNNNKLDIDVENSSDIDNKQEIIQIIKKNTNEEMKTLSINGEINIYTSKNNDKQEERRNVLVQTVTSISPQIMLMANVITKIIFTLDEKAELHKIRHKKL